MKLYQVKKKIGCGWTGKDGVFYSLDPGVVVRAEPVEGSPLNTNVYNFNKRDIFHITSWPQYTVNTKKFLRCVEEIDIEMLEISYGR